MKKISGILLIVFGLLAIVSAISTSVDGLYYSERAIESTFSMGIAFVVLGAFLISQVNKKKREEKEEDEKRKWEQGKTDEE